MKQFFFVLTALLFTVLAAGQSITVTQPNGGEVLYACQQYQVKWNATGTSNFYNIDYSLNNGAIWTSVASNLNITNGQYTWTVPNVESSTCLLRVRDKNDTLKQDISDAVFTIHIPVVVTSPNGGESWAGNTQRAITWNIQGTSLVFNIDYSTNGGTSWTSVVTNYSTATGIYNWTVPNTPSANCLVRVSDATTSCMRDVSDAAFTITPAQPVLLTPNGGEQLSWDCGSTITWNTASFYSPVRLEYSLDSGTTWQLIAASATNSGSYSWSAPATLTTKALIKASNSSNLATFDVSNAVFALVRPVNIVSPNGGDTLYGCENYNVRYTKGACATSTYYLEYSINGGTSWTQIGTSSSGNANITTAWQVPNNITSSLCLVRAYNINSPTTVADTSNTYFTILPSNAITVTSPNGGEVSAAFSNRLITWTNTATASGFYTIEYSSNGGNSWNTIATNISTNSYTWTNIPNVPSTTYLIRVSDFNNTCRSDVSNATFTVTAAQPVLTSPNGGEVLNWDCVANITWNPNTFYSPVRLDYSIDSGLTWVGIITNATNNGGYSWVVPQAISNKVLIRASNSANLSSYDVSNAVFSIARPVTVVAPNGGDTLYGCDTYNVRYTKGACTSGTYYLQYSTDAGASWSLLSTSIGSGTVSTAWQVPNGITSNRCLVKAYNINAAAIADTSNAFFTILPSNSVTVTAPNGGETIAALSNYTITWANTATASGTYNVEYSNDGGTNWIILATNVIGNAYTWTNIPNSPGTTYLVRVSDYSNSCRNDVSNANFTITPAQPLLYTPNGGESLWSGSAYNITWNSATYYSSVRIEYSVDSGATWQIVTASAGNTGTYSWTVPNASSTKCLVKVSNSANTALYDVSNAVFAIKPAVRIFTPNGFDELGACTQTSITFEHTPAFTGYNLEYSINNGSTWTSIITNQTFTGTSGTYSWSLPNLSSTQARVRVYPTGNTALADVSDTTFTIKRAVTIIQPNFGGVLQTGSTYPVIWSSDGISNLYDLAYSTNGGSTWTNIVLGYNTSTNTYNWTVPNAPSTNCLIRIRDNINSCKEDISDLAFTISTTASPITLTAPNGQDTLSGCQSYVIRWAESGTPLGSYNIDYSINGGQSWLPIVANYATTTGTYNWVVPNTATTSALVRVASSANSTVFDLSNAAFTIIGRSVTASADTAICAGNIVQLVATGGNGTYTWTPAATLNNANIANPLATPSATTSYVVTSANGSCAMRDTVVVTVAGGSSGTVAVNITALPSAAVCAGTAIIFTATPANGGTNPTYQWKKNGSNVGTNSTNYILNPATNNDVITCVLTSNAACATNNPATSNAVTVTVFSAQAPAISIATPATTVCSGQLVTFTATATNAGNAPVYQWMVNNTNTGTNSATFTTNTLTNNDVVTCTLTSNAACAANTTATSNALLLTVIPSVVPTVSISTPSTTICNGSSATFTATATNAGTSPVYQWKVNGNNVGSNSATFSSSALNNGDVVAVALTSSATCPLPATVTSNAITITVTGSVVPAVSISTGTTTICAGALATFTAVPVNGGTTPAYQWKVNNTNVGTGSTFSSSTLTNNDTVRVVMTSSSGCASPVTATSAATVITVNPVVSPVVSITGTNSICAGTTVTYTASAVNAGATPAYQWRLNGTNVGGNINTYTTSALANNDTVYCVVTSSSGCAIPNNATSNKIAVTVLPVATPAISITTPATSVCSGTTVVFTATATNGGSTPVYQWKVNGNNTGSNSASYSSGTLNNNDVITCALTSNATCAAPLTATSNAITMLITQVAAPAITISTATTTLCSGANTTFTSAITNGGANPVYQWKVNGTNAGSNSATFTTAALSNNDVVTCQLTSSALCASPAAATSNAIAVSVGTNVTPSITIGANSTSVCAGTAVNFTATITGGGSSPAYQWKVNGTNVGTNSPAFSSSTLTNNAVVTCVLTSNAVCASPLTATSNAVTMLVTPVTTPAITISTASTTICSGANTTFTAAITNGGANPVYQWKVNGTNAGTNSATFSTTTLANNDIVTCQLTSSTLCATPAIVTSNAIAVSVGTNVTPAVSISANTASVCAGSAVNFTATSTGGGSSPAYQWKVNGNNAGTNSPAFSSTTLANNDIVTCVLTSNAVCASPLTATSNAVTMLVTPVTTPTITISTASTTICSGVNTTFTAAITNGGVNPVYQWKVNGTNAGTNSATFSTSTLANNDVVTCQLTSSALCATPAIVTSNAIAVLVGSNVTPTVTISAGNTTVCAGTTVSFTATSTGGGSNPAYQWKVNGANAGTNSPTFSSATLGNNAVVTCVLTSSLVCVTTTSVTSNAVTITVNPQITPAITIVATNTTVCAGTAVSFTATATNAGSTPAYQWKLNGNNTGSNQATYTLAVPANNDVVTCVVTPVQACATPASVTSNAVTLSVTPSVTPAVTISASSTNICGGPITFTAATTNEGNTPVYQWKVNGANAGTNNPVFTTATLSNGDVVSMVLTSGAACITSATAVSNSITVTGSAATPVVTISANNSTACQGAAVTFTATLTNPGTSQVYQWKVNGANAGTNGNTFTTSALSTADTVTCNVTVTSACANTFNVVSNKVSVQILPSLPATVAITASQNNICQGVAITFSATAGNGGATPAYQWKVNGINAGTNNSQFISTTLANNDTITCILTSAASCALPSVATSNAIVMQVTPTVLPGISISPAATTACQGTNLSFTATVTNAGANPAYQWKVNGINAGANSAAFSANNFVNGDVVTCQVTSSAACAQPVSVTSNAATVTITTPVTPTVSINANTTTACSGTAVVFTAISANGGTAPVYTWLVNGNAVSTGNNTFSSINLANGDVVSCELTSNATCVTTASALSNTFAVNITTTVTPTVSVVASDTTICQGTTVTFTATTTNGGTTPIYQWMVNGNAVGSNSSTYTTTGLENGNEVTCMLTSSATCATTQVATSPDIVVAVNAGVQPTVTLVASADSVCQGSTLTYTAIVNNAGSNAQYNWLVNNNSVGVTTPVFTTGSLADGDTVVCRITSNAACSNGVVVATTPVVAHIVSLKVPAVTILANDSSICAGQNVVFTANATNGGLAPVYQWQVNGNNVGGNAATYASATLANSDVVTVKLTSSETCATIATVESAPITVLVETAVVSSVSVTTIPNDTICQGTMVTLTANAINGGNSPVYQWSVNGVAEGANSATYTSNSLSNGDVVSLEFTSSANCVAQATIAPTPVAFTVNATPAVPVILQTGNVLTSNTPIGNQWYAAWQPINGATGQTYTVNGNGWYSVVVTDANGCSSASDSLLVQYSGIADIDWNKAISISPNPFVEQFSVNFSADVFTASEWTLTVLDMLGRVAYESKVTDAHMVVDFTHRAAGTYTVCISDGHILRTYKVVKQ